MMLTTLPFLELTQYSDTGRRAQSALHSWRLSGETLDIRGVAARDELRHRVELRRRESAAPTTPLVRFAGAGNDFIGWTLLALSVALANAASGLMALWTVLVRVGWALFLLLIVHVKVRHAKIGQ